MKKRAEDDVISGREKQWAQKDSIGAMSKGRICGKVGDGLRLERFSPTGPEARESEGFVAVVA